MSSLYRKYRPQQFRDVVGQDHVIQTVTNALSSGTSAHAYLLTGPRGVGKTTIARLLAKAVNCLTLGAGAEPCNNCLACAAINQNNALDVLEIDAASHTGVDHVREQIIEQARFHPAQLKMKVFIIDEVHMLSTAAFNALLKILEEPPAHVMFILATTELHKVPATIISRCQRFDLHKVETPVVVEVLKKIIATEDATVAEEVLFRVARVSGGCLRDAEGLLGQLLALGGGTVGADQADLLLPPSQLGAIVQWFTCLVDKNLGGALECLNQLAENSVNLEAFTKEASEVLRQLLLGKVDANLARDLFQDPAIGELCRTLVNRTELIILERWLEELLKTREWFRQTEIPLLPLELFSLRAIELIVEARESRKVEPRPPPDTPTRNSVNKMVVQAPPSKEAAPAASSKVLGQALSEVWSSIVQEVRKRNTSVGGCLKLGQVLEIGERHVQLGFRYKFYLDRVNDHKNRDLIAQVARELFGQPVKLEAVLLENKIESLLQAVATPTPPADALLQNILSTFGGEVVE